MKSQDFTKSRVGCVVTQCASAFSNPDQIVHTFFHYYIVATYETIQNQLKETSDIKFPIK